MIKHFVQLDYKTVSLFIEDVCCGLFKGQHFFFEGESF